MITGLGFLALAMCGSLLLVATKLFGVTTGAVTVGLAATSFVVVWFALPLRRKAKLDSARPLPEKSTPEQQRAATELQARRVP
jgi:hypothetical protein